jgi:hypothetical protein
MRSRRFLAGLLLTMLASQAQADGVIAYGKADGKTPGWAISTSAPAGWTADCCQYARAIGVNLVIYRGEWTGEPDQVIVLNVWPRKLPTLEAEWQDDRKHYLQRDPAGKFQPFVVQASKSMTCNGSLYQGSDHVDDVVVFCDPGEPTGIRLSWSMTLAANTANRQQALDQFRQVVARSSYMAYEDKHSAPAGGSSKGKPQGKS